MYDTLIESQAHHQIRDRVTRASEPHLPVLGRRRRVADRLRRLADRLDT